MPRVLNGHSFGRDLRESVEELRSSSSSGVAVREDRGPIFGVKISDFGEISFNLGCRFVIFGIWSLNLRTGCSIKVSRQDRVVLLDTVV